MSASCECVLLSDRGLCVGLFASPEKSYRVWCVWVWSWSLDNEETLVHRGCCAIGYIYIYPMSRYIYLMSQYIYIPCRNIYISHVAYIYYAHPNRFVYFISCLTRTTIKCDSPVRFCSVLHHDIQTLNTNKIKRDIRQLCTEQYMFCRTRGVVA
jgi:hypothetical protein